jgi:hypothetical protein
MTMTLDLTRVANDIADYLANYEDDLDAEARADMKDYYASNFKVTSETLTWSSPELGVVVIFHTDKTTGASVATAVNDSRSSSTSHPMTSAAFPAWAGDFINLVSQ